jgi:dTDP-4-dehydrorhamnose 3,5-epimerase
MEPILHTAITGVQLVKPIRRADGRGLFFEAFRASWFNGDHCWVQWNVSRSNAGVLRGMHFHLKQTDYWQVVEGGILIGLVDLRRSSPTHRRTVCLEIDSSDGPGLLIPPGVLHGYRSLRDSAVMYLLDQEYTGADEYAVRWDDADLALPRTWYSQSAPVLSARDAAAPLLSAVGGILP